MTAIPLLLAVTAFAQDPKFDKDLKTLPDGAEAELPTVEKHLKAGLGGVYGSGNARFLTVTGSLDGAYRRERNRIALNGNGQYGSAVVDTDGDGTVAGEKDGRLVLNSRIFQGQLRYDRFVSPRNSLYALVGGLHDPFKGLSGRANGRLGGSRQVVASEPVDLHVALGADYAREWFTPSATEQSGIARNDVIAAMVFHRVTWRLNGHSSITEEVEALFNVEEWEDIRVNARGALTTSLSSKLSVQLAVDLRFDNVPAAPSFAKTDVITSVSLVANVF